MGSDRRYHGRGWRAMYFMQSTAIFSNNEILVLQCRNIVSIGTIEAQFSAWQSLTGAFSRPRQRS